MTSRPERAEVPTVDEVLKKVGAPKATGGKRVLRQVVLGAVVLGLVAGLVFWKTRPAPAALKFLTAAVKRGDLAATVSATGALRGKDTVSIGAETSGRVKSVSVDFNDEVKQGQVLAEIDSSQIQAALSQSTAQLLAARADVKNRDASAVEARLAAERTRALAADGLASKQQLEAAVAAADRAAASSESARAQVTVAEAAVASNQTALGKTQVRSPIDGVVLSRDVEVGQALAVAMTTPVLFKVAKDLRRMEVTISIDEADVGRTRPGQHATFTVDAWPGRAFKGELASIHNVAVTKDNVVTYDALLSVDNDERVLRPGMTATVTIATDERQGVLMVPNAAMRFSPPSTEKRTMFNGPPGGPEVVSDGKPRVWVLRDQRPVEVKVELGLSDGVHTEVRAEGLAEGDQVIVDAEQVAK